MSGPKIAVAGAGGRVGRLLIPAFAARGSSVVVQSSGELPGAASFDPLADDGEAFARWLRRERADLVVLLWGVTAAGADRPLHLNRHMALTGYRAARRAGVGHVVAISSAAVYAPEPGHPPFVEKDAGGRGLSPYGAAKLEMEQALLEAQAEARGDAQLTILRLANVVGADALAGSIRSASEDRPLRLDRFPDSRTPMRSYLGPMTLATVLTELADARSPSEPRILNVAESESPLEMAAILDALARAGRPIPWKEQPAPTGAVAELAINPSALRRLLPGATAAFGKDADALVADWLALEDLP
jgi:UDP-glucose 4-epimerase